ncbi:MAG: penicillin-binding transpeptidase domain-containing protein [Candidatus Omnitrophota bacterium]
MIRFLFIFLWMLPFDSHAQDSLNIPFEQCDVSGSITVYDYTNNVWTFSDEADARRETLPASTFKIINSCIALETGAVQDEDELIRWDKEERTFNGQPIEAWNRDNDLKSAYKNSTVWFYVELAKRIGRARYKEFLAQCRYGNMDLSEEDTAFWIKGDFGVSPVNQIEFLTALYKEELPFSPRTFRIVKQLMISEQTDHYILRDKTGWTQSGGRDIGWWVGYVERKDHVYFFATRITKDENAVNEKFSACRKEITRTILKQLGAIE